MAQRRSVPTIRAAGGVVWRRRDGVLEIALVHRPRYDDWSLPKGKLETGESELTAAVREVAEELGSRVAVSRRLRTIGYPVADQHKTVAFWVMRHLDGTFEPNDEVDEVQWLPVDTARTRLSYTVERDVVDDFAATPVPDSVVVLARHAKAGKRSDWKGDDAKRPLDKTGRAQARRLATFLAHFGADRVLAAAPVRCVQTVTPFAQALGVEVVVDPVFSDEDFVLAPEATEAALLALAVPGRVTVVCSQGTTIPNLIDALAPATRTSETRKGAAWVLCVVDGVVAAADYYPDAPR